VTRKGVLFAILLLASSAQAEDYPAPSETAPTADAPGLSPGSASPLAAPAEPAPEPPAAVEVPKETTVEAEPIPRAEDPHPAPRLSTYTRKEREAASAYRAARPTFGVSMIGSVKALGGQALVPEQGTASTWGASIQFEYQPAFIQRAGVLGFGISGGLYPISPIGTATSSAFGVFSGGAQVRYQLRYFQGQPIVPYGGYGAEYIWYQFTSSGSGSLLAQGPFFGGMLLLNWIEPSVSHRGFIDNGLARSYLTGEARMLQGSDNVLNFSGMSFYFGLRMEFI